jgi:flagellar hook assembly protein FlgD
VPGVVRVDVTDIAGRKVATLAEGFQSPGRYTREWDGRDQGGRDVPSGVYWVRLGDGVERVNSAERVTVLR